jgi:chemotaxis protein MotD
MSVPQVASPSNKVHAHNHAQTRTARTAPADRGGTPSLFDSLVDQSSQQAQGDNPAVAQPSGQKPAVGQAAKTDAGKDQSPQPGADSAVTAPAEPATGGQPPFADAAVKAAAASAAEPNAQDAAKDAGDKDAGPSDAAAADQPAPTIDPSLAVNTPAAAAAIAPPPAAIPQPAATDDATASAVSANPPAAAVITTAPATVPTQPGPVEPAFVAAATAQKLQPFQAKDAGKDKPQPDKPAATNVPAAAAPQPSQADDQAVPPPAQPGTTPAAAVDAKPDPADKAAAKDAQPRRERADAAVAKADAFSLTAPDGSAAAGTQSASTLAGTSSTNGTNASAANAAPQGASNGAPAATVPVAGLAVEIAGRAHAGKNHFEIRLDPPELGRIEVKLSVDRHGQITSHLIADRPDTLDLLRRDATGLMRSLQDAGLKTAGDGLQFSLRDQSFNGGQNGDNRSNASQAVAIDDTLPAVDVGTSGYTRYIGRIGGVDIRV